MLPLTFWWVIPMVLWAYARDPPAAPGAPFGSPRGSPDGSVPASGIRASGDSEELLPELPPSRGSGVSLPEVPPPNQEALQDVAAGLARMMEDDELFKEYYRCLVDLGPCTKDTSKFKEFVSEALERGCARCSDGQRAEAIALLRVVMECRPREYERIERQYDPSGAFKTKYKASSLAARRRSAVGRL